MTSTDSARAERAWGRVRFLFWLGAALALVCWRGRVWRDALEPSFFRPQFFVADFFQEWASARNALEGIPVYSPHHIAVARYLHQQVDTSDPGFLPENAHPPVAVLLGLPFAWLDFPEALCLWKLISLGLLIASVWLIAATLRLQVLAWQVVAGFAALLLCYPLQDHMLHGQLNLLLLFLVALAWRADRCGRPTAAGIWAALAFTLKLFPGLLLLYFLVLRKWRALLVAMGSSAALMLFAGLALGFDALETYFLEVLPRTSRWWGRWDNESLPAIAFKLFAENRNYPPFAAVPWLVDDRLAWAVALLGLAGFLGILGWLVYRAGSAGDTDRAFAMTVSGMLLASPICWVHYMVIVILPLLIVWPRLGKLGRETLILLVAILCLPPWTTVEYALLLLHGSPTIVGPWQTLTVLSLPCYAQLGILALTATAAEIRIVEFRPARQAASL